MKEKKQKKKNVYGTCGNWKDQYCSYIDHETCLKDCAYDPLPSRKIPSESIKTSFSFPLSNVRLISLQILSIKDVSQLKQQKNMALLQEDLICWMMKHVWVLLI